MYDALRLLGFWLRNGREVQRGHPTVSRMKHAKKQDLSKFQLANPAIEGHRQASCGYGKEHF
jgi:hypothetical protein